jgi:hypothetical protein
MSSGRDAGALAKRSAKGAAFCRKRGSPQHRLRPIAIVTTAGSVASQDHTMGASAMVCL